MDKVCCPTKSSLVDLYSQSSFESCGSSQCDVFDQNLWPGRFLEPNKYCDGVKDCREGIDELGCGSCKQDEFRCKADHLTNGFICMDVTKVCDGVKNCQDGSDEMGCLFQYGQCGPDQFRCGNELFGAQQCIPQNLVCNGVKDCSDGMDEVNCDQTRADEGLARFQCNNGNLIETRKICQEESACGDSSDQINCFQWYLWGDWVESTCSSMCMKMRIRQCRSMVDGRVDQTAAFCPLDGSLHQVAPDPTASAYEYSIDYAATCNEALYPEACQERAPEPECTQCFATPRDESGKILDDHVSCCQGQLIDNTLSSPEINLGQNIYGIDDLGQCLKRQDSLLGNLQEFKCCGACASTLNLVDCKGFMANRTCIHWWIILLVLLAIILIIFLILCWYFEWLCFKKTEKGIKELPVEHHNRAAEIDPEYINHNIGTKSPAIRKATRTMIMKPTTDNDVRNQVIDEDLNYVVQQSRNTISGPVGNSFDSRPSSSNVRYRDNGPSFENYNPNIRNTTVSQGQRVTISNIPNNPRRQTEMRANSRESIANNLLNNYERRSQLI